MSKRRVLRTFNYLNRTRIPASGVAIDALVVGGKPVARYRQLDLPTDHGHDPDRWKKADVVVEAWRGRSASWVRHPLGKVVELERRLRTPFSLDLTDFNDAEDVTFRVKVVAADTQQILAEADRLLPANEASPSTMDELIQVKRDPELGEQPWRIDWDDLDRGPMVLVSNKLTAAETFFTRDAAFVAATMPEIMRNVLFRLALEPDQRDQAWAAKWLAFAKRFVDSDAPDEADFQQSQSWADEVVASFCARHNFVTQANKVFLNSDPAVE